MTIKNRPAKFFAAIFACIFGGALLYAQPAASTNKSDTNAVTVTAKSSVAGTNILATTNSAAAEELKHKALLDEARVHARPVNGSPPGGIYLRNGDYIPENPIFGKTIVALAAIISPFILAFSLPAIIIFTVFSFRHRQSKMMHETVRAMIEKGVPVSPEMIAGLTANGLKLNIQGKWDRARPRNRHLLPGLILTGAGIALIIGLPEHSGPGGLIILFIGLAFLIVWLVERRENRNDERNPNISNEGTQQTERKQDNDQQPLKSS